MMIRNAVRLLDQTRHCWSASGASAVHPHRRISGLQFQQHHPGAASCRRRAEHFCRGRSRPGDLSVPWGSSAAFEEFQKRFPLTEGVVLDENQRSLENILRVAFAAINENPPVQSLGDRVKFQRAQLESGRDRRDQQEGRFVFDEPVEIVLTDCHEERGCAHR